MPHIARWPRPADVVIRDAGCGLRRPVSPAQRRRSPPPDAAGWSRRPRALGRSARPGRGCASERSVRCEWTRRLLSVGISVSRPDRSRRPSVRAPMVRMSRHAQKYPAAPTRDASSVRFGSTRAFLASRHGLPHRRRHGVEPRSLKEEERWTRNRSPHRPSRSTSSSSAADRQDSRSAITSPAGIATS